MPKYPSVTIKEFTYQITSVATWEFGYTVEGQRLRIDSSCSINTPIHYRNLRGWQIEQAEILGQLLKVS